MSANPAAISKGRKSAAAPERQRRIFTLQDIPDVMQQQHGWKIASQLMRRWFAAPHYSMPYEVKNGDVDPAALPAQVVDESTVTMAWVLGFARARLAMNQLLNNWISPKSVDRLKRHVYREAKGKARNSCWGFGNLSLPARQLEVTCQVNFLSVGERSDPLDDFYGAIGRGTLKLAAAGSVDDALNRKILTITEVGIYLRDTYEFLDKRDDLISQPLGYWGWKGVKPGWGLRPDIAILPSSEMAPEDAMYEVQNDDFREFQKLTPNGGDFMIYSDVHVLKLPQALQFPF